MKSTSYWASILASLTMAICVSGPGAASNQRRPIAPKPQPAAASWAETNAALLWRNQVTGQVLSVEGTTAHLETRDQRSVELDASVAIEEHRVNALKAGAFITAVGAYDAKGVFHARAIFRAKSQPSGWAPDR